MKTNLLFLLFPFMLTLPAHSGFCQEDSTAEITPLKNAIHGSLGYALLGGSISGGFSRFIGETNKKFYASYWIGLDIGGFVFWEDSWRFIDMDVTVLTGSGKNHLELSAGIARLKDMWSYENPSPGLPDKYWISYTPAGALGYRFQRPAGISFFRTGIGFPDFLYVGTGLRF